MTRTAQAQPSRRRSQSTPATIRAILCHATGKAYTNETDAYLNGCDIEGSEEAEIPADVEYVWHGTPPNGGDKVVLLDGRKGFDWLMRAGAGASLTVLMVARQLH